MILSNGRYKALTRFFAGFLEKLSVASLAVGLFQGNPLGLVVGATFLIISAGIVCYLGED